MTNTSKSIKDNQQDLEKLYIQRRHWLWASSVVFGTLILIIFFWDWIDSFGSKTVWWVVVSFMLIISINWWYWSMRVIRKLIHHQSVEYSLLRLILVDLRKIKQDLRRMEAESVDKSK